MPITMQPATPETLGPIVDAVASWQHTGGPVQLHPGDLGWHWRFGARELAAAMRVWARDGQIVAVGLLEHEDGLIRLAIAPSVDNDAAFAGKLLSELSGLQAVEARSGTALRDLLRRTGWTDDEPWTPLSRDLGEPVPDSGLTIKTIDTYALRQHLVADRVAVQRAAFARSTFTVQRWHAMAEAPPYRRARCLIGYDGAGEAVAAATVWSAGEGRPGLLEPLGVHRDHRGHGYGRAITLAAAAALREMGSSTATVCTPSSNVGAVHTYVSGGFRNLGEVTDFRAPAAPSAAPDRSA